MLALHSSCSSQKPCSILSTVRRVSRLSAMKDAISSEISYLRALLVRTKRRNQEIRIYKRQKRSKTCTSKRESVCGLELDNKVIQRIQSNAYNCAVNWAQQWRIGFMDATVGGGFTLKRHELENDLLHARYLAVCLRYRRDLTRMAWGSGLTVTTMHVTWYTITLDCPHLRLVWV